MPVNNNIKYKFENGYYSGNTDNAVKLPDIIGEKSLALFENTSTGIILINCDGLITCSNSLFSYITGYTGNELNGLRFSSFFCDEDSGKVEEMILLCFSGCTPNANFEVKFRRKGGTPSWGELSFSPAWEEGDNSKYCYAFLNDISEERKYRDAAKVAMKKVSLLGNFAKNDIMDRITAIECYLELAHDNINPDCRQFCSVVSRHMESIKRYMDFTSELHDVGLFRPEWQLLSEIFDDAGSFDKRIPIEYDIRFKKAEVLSDRLLSRVFEKLFENSVKHGKFTTKINIIFSEDESGSFSISWKDNGIGISAEMKDKLFQKRYGDDRGLGMLMVKEILALSGAEIKERGVPGEGAVFEIKYPPECCRYFD